MSAAAPLSHEVYFERKNDILARCLRLSEDILGALTDADALDALLARRMTVIEELRALEAAVSDETRAACPSQKLDHLKDRLELILALDKKAVASIETLRAELVHSMKSNTREQTLMGYTAGSEPSSGGRLDKKK